MLVYLDQNYASRMAKAQMGRPGHEPFGRLFLALRGRALAPPSPFHVLETLHPVRGPKEKAGYLRPALEALFHELGQGYWVRPWEEVARRQLRGLHLEDLLWREGSWERPADLSPFLGLLEGLRGLPPKEAYPRALEEVERRVGLKNIPFTRLLARLLAQSLEDPTRKPRPSDLLDFVMAATVYPYVDLLLTDRYLKNLLQRVGPPGRAQVFGGRKREVERLLAHLGQVDLGG